MLSEISKLVFNDNDRTEFLVLKFWALKQKSTKSDLHVISAVQLVIQKR